MAENAKTLVPDGMTELGLMYRNLSEGHEGGRFRAFATSNSVLGAHVINHALTLYRANYPNWTNMSAFAQNYLETALRVAEAHVPYPAKTHIGRNARTSVENIWYDLVWTVWAEFCSSFAMGE